MSHTEDRTQIEYVWEWVHRDEVTGGWRRCFGEDLCNLYSLPILVWSDQKWMRWVGHLSHMWAMRNTYKILIAKPERKRKLGWSRGVDRIVKWILQK